MNAAPAPPTGRRADRTIGLAALAALLLAPPAAANPPPSPPLFGVVAQTEPTAAEFETMSEGGVGTYRWLISWPVLQASPSAGPDWTATDRVAARLAEVGIKPIPLIHGSPCFVVDCETVDPPSANSQPPLGSPRARRAWAGFLRSLVARYGPHGALWSENRSIPYRPIRVWQVWNEQNAPVYWRPSPSAQRYADLLAISSRAIRSRDPGAQILLGGMFGHPDSPAAVPGPEFLDRLYRIAGARRHFDGVAVHPYSRDVAGMRRQIGDMRRVLTRNDDSNTPIWITELGWATGARREGRFIETREGQARRFEQAFRLVSAKREHWNIASALWFAWRDVPPGRRVCRWCHTAGLIDAEGRPKPAWTAYRELSSRVSAGPEDRGGVSLAALVALAASLLLAVTAGAFLLRRAGQNPATADPKGSTSRD